VRNDTRGPGWVQEDQDHLRVTATANSQQATTGFHPGVVDVVGPPQHSCPSPCVCMYPCMLCRAWHARRRRAGRPVRGNDTRTISGPFCLGTASANQARGWNQGAVDVAGPPQPNCPTPCVCMYTSMICGAWHVRRRCTGRPVRRNDTRTIFVRGASEASHPPHKARGAVDVVVAPTVEPPHGMSSS